MLRRVALLHLALTASLGAQTRHARSFGVDQGLVPAYVVSLAEDPDGLLWIGTAGGLYRYDGVEMRRWAPESLRSWVSVLSIAPDGTIILLDEDQGGVYAVTPDGVTPVPGPDGRPLRGVHHLAVDGGGALWALRGSDALLRDTGGRWAARSHATLDGARLHRVFAAPAGGAFVLTGAGVWHVTAGGAPARVAQAREPRHVLPLPDGRLLVVTFDGEVFEFRDGRGILLLDLVARGIQVAERNGTYWVAFDRYLASLGPGAEPEILGPEDGVASGGPLLVDHEGSLWLGTFSGLLQFPEPDARIWTERHGLPIAHTRFLVKTGDTLWVNTWMGTATLARVAGRWRVREAGELARVRRLFVSADGSLVGTTFRSPRLLLSFAARGDGSEWYGTPRGLFVARAPDAAREAVAGLPFASDTVPIDAVLHDRAGRTWLASGRQVCHAPRVDPGPAAGGGWTCDEIRSGQHVTGMVEHPAGTVWASFVRGGVWRHRNGAWDMLERSGQATPFDILGMVPSPSGGVWLFGTGTAMRVVEDSGSPGGPRVAETLSGWHGLRTSGAEDILEEPDGSLWLATSVGVARIPGGARRPASPPGRVVLVDASVDDDHVSVRDELILSHGRNRLTLHFAAASYRDPSLLRYQVRVAPDDPWTTVAGPPVFRWVNLPPGRYQAEVRASLDGLTWTAQPARFAFRVLPPWYASRWALAAFLLAAAGAVTAVFRARVAFLVGLERQRTRIAMDLHDEMGSGLGSIGILSGVLAGRPGDAPDRRKLATQIAEISQDLGTALSDIVWSLDPRSSTLEEVAGRLAEHGGRLFAGDGAQFAVHFPSAWPATPLDFPMRRGVLLIGLEALHNAARHARARQVTLAVHPAGAAWELVVEDDGCGLPEAARTGDRVGLGLQSLRRRADELGGRIEWSDRPGGGTRVAFAFHVSGRPTGRRRRLT